MSKQAEYMECRDWSWDGKESRELRLEGGEGGTVETWGRVLGRGVASAELPRRGRSWKVPDEQEICGELRG